MCIAYLSLGVNPHWPVFIAANRDEYHHRPALPAGPWPDAPHVIAGRDLSAGGTWLGLSRGRRWALLTNFREPGAHRDGLRSRGRLVSDFLLSDIPVDVYTKAIHEEAGQYNGFNLIAGEGLHAWYVGNHAACAGPVLLGPGRYALSNHALDTPWPKVERLRSSLDSLMPKDDSLVLEPMYEALRDGLTFEDDALPRTGLPLAVERMLSSVFIVSPDYGTRCSTLIALDAQGNGIFSETSYDSEGTPRERHDWPVKAS
ncbi:MAG TPA: NRDE family protein [Burkholderiaceae bacterium]|jgi:uncharacterized protein with NRDE domain|nr:NRDE family protein [Burkholderiaceae bacterium]